MICGMTSELLSSCDEDGCNASPASATKKPKLNRSSSSRKKSGLLDGDKVSNAGSSSKKPKVEPVSHVVRECKLAVLSAEKRLDLLKEPVSIDKINGSELARTVQQIADNFTDQRQSILAAEGQVVLAAGLRDKIVILKSASAFTVLWSNDDDGVAERSAQHVGRHACRSFRRYRFTNRPHNRHCSAVVRREMQIRTR